MDNPYAPPRTESFRPQPTTTNNANARSVGFVILAGIVVPGLPSMLMGRTGIGVLLLLVVPIAYAIFGPIWGLFLFAGTPYSQHGFYPFVLVLIATPTISVVHGLLVRRQLLRRLATSA